MDLRGLFAAIFIYALCQDVLASFIGISMSMSTPVFVHSPDFELNLSIVNSGDEPAMKPSFEVMLPGFRQQGDFHVDALAPGVDYGFSERFPVSESNLEGLYFGFIRVTYFDGNSHPFSVVGPFIYRYVRDSVSEVSVSAEPVELSASGGGRATVRVTNEGALPRQVTLTAFTPAEIGASFDAGAKSVAPGASVEYVVEFSSGEALEGSHYSVYYVAEYEAEGVHFSSLGDSPLSVVASRPAVGLSWIPGVALLCLVFAFIAYQVYLVAKRLTDGK